MVGLVAASIAAGVAGLALQQMRVPEHVRAAARRPLVVLEAVRQLQSGHVGDYVAWMTAGVALLTGGFAITLL